MRDMSNQGVMDNLSVAGKKLYRTNSHIHGVVPVEDQVCVYVAAGGSQVGGAGLFKD